jgi:hypothetical protein
VVLDNANKDSPQLNKIALDEALSGGRLLRGRHADDQSPMRTQVSAVFPYVMIELCCRLTVVAKCQTRLRRP